MYIIDAVEELYESADISSPQEYVSAYILQNLRVIPAKTLSSLAEEIGVSKGYLSKYVSRLTAEGTYAAFQNALSQEFGYSCPDPEQIIAEARRCVKGTGMVKLPDRQIRQITDAIGSCGCLWIIGDRSCRGVFTHLLRALWANGKRAKYISGSRLTRSPGILSCIAAEDLVIIVSVTDSPDEYILKCMPTLDILGILKRRKCETVYVGEDHGSRGIPVFSLGDTLGSFTSLIALQQFAAALTESFMVRKRQSVHNV